MVLTTTETISGRNLITLGLVVGSMIQSKHIGKDIGSGFRNIVGGEMKAYTEMMNESREIAIQRMIGQAAAMGADAVVAMRITTSSIVQGAAEVMVYGTAVKFA